MIPRVSIEVKSNIDSNSPIAIFKRNEEVIIKSLMYGDGKSMLNILEKELNDGNGFLKCQFTYDRLNNYLDSFKHILCDRINDIKITE